MATAAGIDMSECRLHHEGGRNHFMTRRFDRDERGRKVHMQSLGAMQHFDFNDPASYSYEQANMTIRDLGLGMDVVAQQYKRAVFIVVARNQDDHVKNISFLMDRSGAWRLSPAYDVAYSYNPSGSSRPLERPLDPESSIKKSGLTGVGLGPVICYEYIQAGLIIGQTGGKHGREVVEGKATSEFCSRNKHFSPAQFSAIREEHARFSTVH